MCIALAQSNSPLRHKQKKMISVLRWCEDGGGGRVGDKESNSIILGRFARLNEIENSKHPRIFPPFVCKMQVKMPTHWLTSAASNRYQNGSMFFVEPQRTAEIYNIHFLSARFLICQRLHSNRSADWIYDAVATQSNLSLIKLPPQIIRQYDLLLRKAVIVGNWSGATLCELLLARPGCRCTNRSNVH